MSDSLILDTDVASYLFKNSPRKAVSYPAERQAAGVGVRLDRRVVQVDLEARLGPGKGRAAVKPPCPAMS